MTIPVMSPPLSRELLLGEVDGVGAEDEEEEEEEEATMVELDTDAADDLISDVGRGVSVTKRSARIRH